MQVPKAANPLQEIKGEGDKAALEAQNDQIRALKMKKADPEYLYPDKTIHEPVQKPVQNPLPAANRAAAEKPVTAQKTAPEDD